MKRALRSLCKLLGMALVTSGVYACYLAGYSLLRLMGRRYEPWRNRCLKWWAPITARLLSLQIEIRGEAPKAPFFLISNHLSTLDILLFHYSLHCTFVAKKEVKSWPLIGFMCSTLGVIFIDRHRKTDVRRVNRLVADALHEHQGVVLFPEGGTSDGTSVLPFKASLLKHPAAGHYPVHYAAISYRTEKGDPPAKESVCWWGTTSFFRHAFELAGNRQIHGTIQFGSESVRTSERKKLAEELHHKISTLCRQQFAVKVNDN